MSHSVCAWCVQDTVKLNDEGERGCLPLEVRSLVERFFGYPKFVNNSYILLIVHSHLKVSFYYSYSRNPFEHKQFCKGVEISPMSTNTALGSERCENKPGWRLEVSLCVPLHRLSPMKCCETNIQQMLYSMLLITSFFIVG